MSPCRDLANQALPRETTKSGKIVVVLNGFENLGLRSPPGVLQDGSPQLPSQERTLRSVHRLRHAARERAEEAALRVPWPRVQEAAIAYANWQVFALEVRSACEPSGSIPPAVASTLNARCPRFLAWEHEQRNRQASGHSVWRSLLEWISDNEFADAHRKGWYDAVAYYGLKRIECIRAWAEWTRANVPVPGPILDLPTSPKLPAAVDGLLESRALLLWTTALTPEGAGLQPVVMTQLGSRLHRTTVDQLSPWNRSAFLRLALDLDKQCMPDARKEGWFAALRHQFLHHPRYHRLVHFCLHCRNEWRDARPRPTPSFEQWKQACDRYLVPHSSLR